VGSGAAGLPFAAEAVIDFGPVSGRRLVYLANVNLIDVLSHWMSRGEARRLIQQGGVKIDDYAFRDGDYVRFRRGAHKEEQIELGETVTVGSHKFVRFVARPYPRWRVVVETVIGWLERIWNR